MQAMQTYGRYIPPPRNTGVVKETSKIAARKALLRHSRGKHPASSHATLSAKLGLETASEQSADLNLPPARTPETTSYEKTMAKRNGKARQEKFGPCTPDTPPRGDDSEKYVLSRRKNPVSLRHSGQIDSKIVESFYVAILACIEHVGIHLGMEGLQSNVLFTAKGIVKKFMEVNNETRINIPFAVKAFHISSKIWHNVHIGVHDLEDITHCFFQFQDYVLPCNKTLNEVEIVLLEKTKWEMPMFAAKGAPLQGPDPPRDKPWAFRCVEHLDMAEESWNYGKRILEMIRSKRRV